MSDRMKQIATVLQAERLQQAEDFNELGNAIAFINPASATTTRLPMPLKTVKEMRHMQEANQRDLDKFRDAVRIPLDRTS